MPKFDKLLYGNSICCPKERKRTESAFSVRNIAQFFLTADNEFENIYRGELISLWQKKSESASVVTVIWDTAWNLR